MSNETGKAIYKEYVNKWIDCQSHEQRHRLNECYCFEGKRVDQFNEGTEFTMLVVDGLYSEFTRAPKMQIINGAEVVAPRYDEPDNDEVNMFYYAPLSALGYCDIEFGDLVKPQNLTLLGWFDNAADALAYAQAHKQQ